MTEPQATQPVPENDPAAATTLKPEDTTATEPEAPPAPEPEPWTPERATEWNAYYDRYVIGAVLLLVLVVSCNYVSDPTVFFHLRAGRVIAENSGPVTTDPFSYTEPGQTWVDVPWLFQWAQSSIYNAIYAAVPVDPTDPTANRDRADRIAIGGLGFLDALVRLATAWILLKIRHRGPGAWWSALCVAMALGTFYDPITGIAPGGLATVPGIGSQGTSVTPAAWGRLFLALELLIVFRSLGQGRSAWLWGLVPLFVLWANCDPSFLTGLIILAAIAIGHILDGGTLDWSEATDPDAKKASEPPPGVPTMRPMMVLGLCALACLANPWTFRVYGVAAGPFLRLFRSSGELQLVETLSFFSGTIKQQLEKLGGESASIWTFVVAFYLLVVATGLGSFLINSARFSWRRFLAFAAVSALWGCMIRYSAEFAIVTAATAALNGQEWYQARFGTRGRLGTGWALWSTGGRIVTLLLIFAMVGVAITGQRVYKAGVHFGLGYNADEFPVEAADFLERQNEITGNIFNTSMDQGDLLLWKAYPKRKVFIDHRTDFFPASLRTEWNEIQGAIRDDNVEVWRPFLDRYKISAIMIEPTRSPRTYGNLFSSPNWVPFYDDGRIVMFGRHDAPKSDLAVFEANRLEPSRIYHASRQLSSADAAPPTPSNWMDDVFQNRLLDRSSPRIAAARRWLVGGQVTSPAPGAGQPAFRPIPEPARCLLAIQEARIALAGNPDDPNAYRILSEAYRMLTQQEGALIAGIALTPENAQRIATLSISPDRLVNRFRQRITALNYAIQTTPTPTTPEGRDELFDQNMQLHELYLAAGFRDLARDRLGIALELNPTEDHVPKEARLALQNQFNQLDEYVKKVERQMDDFSLEQQPRADALANYARQQGAIGLAINKLADAETSGDMTALVKPQLVDLYCDTGQPEKAMDLFVAGAIGDPNLGAEPGMAIYRQGLVYYLLGNYLSTASLWGDRAIRQLQMSRAASVIGAGRSLYRGQGLAAVNGFLSIPGNLGLQASWEYELGLCELEAGRPEEAARHLANALNLEPDMTNRPIAAYYLEKLGKPVPASRKKKS